MWIIIKYKVKEINLVLNNLKKVIGEMPEFCIPKIKHTKYLGNKPKNVESFLLEDYLHAIKFKNESSSVISREEITTVISKSLEGVQVTSEDDMNSVSNWDSLSHIIIIRAIEKSVGYSFTPQEIAQSTSVESIYNTVNRLNKN